MEATTNIPASAPAVPGHVTRIARRRARPGQEAAYEALVREMFGQMRASKGFLAADLLPPEAPGGDYQVVINFASEADLAAWDACPARAAIHARMREVAEAEPEYRSLSGLEAWFAPAVVPASMHPPRVRMAVVTWLGIFPTVSFFLYFVAPTERSRLLMSKLKSALPPLSNACCACSTMALLSKPLSNGALFWVQKRALPSGTLGAYKRRLKSSPRCLAVLPSMISSKSVRPIRSVSFSTPKPAINSRTS